MMSSPDDPLTSSTPMRTSLPHPVARPIERSTFTERGILLAIHGDLVVPRTVDERRAVHREQDVVSETPDELVDSCTVGKTVTVRAGHQSVVPEATAELCPPAVTLPTSSPPPSSTCRIVSSTTTESAPSPVKMSWTRRTRSPSGQTPDATLMTTPTAFSWYETASSALRLADPEGPRLSGR